MESKPKRWRIQSLSQRLEPTDMFPMQSCTTNDLFRPRDQSFSYSDSRNVTTHSYNIGSFTCTQSLRNVSSQRKKVRHKAMVQDEQAAVLHDMNQVNYVRRPDSPSSSGSPTSNTGLHGGFCSFVDDPSSPEAEMNKTWMVSHERKMKLVTLKNKEIFKLQTYSTGRKPQSLFDENKGDSRYQVDHNGVHVVNKHEEKQLRKEIIYSQAPKQNPTFKKQWSVLDHLNISNSPNRIMEHSNRNFIIRHLRGGDTGEGSLYSDYLQSKGRDTQSTSGYTETPIQRKIFITRERERCSQGIKHTNVNVKAAEINTKATQPKPAFTSFKKEKTKHIFHFLIQQEVKKSNLEEDLLKQEKGVDLYDHWASQELEEKKKIFEQGAEENNNSIHHTMKKGLGVKVRHNSSDVKHYLNSCSFNKVPEETEFATHSIADKQKPIHHDSPSILEEQRNKMTVSKNYSPTTLMPKFDKTKSSYPCNSLTGRPSCFCVVTAQPWSSSHATVPVMSRNPLAVHWNTAY